MNDRKGDWMQTASGRRFWPLDPRADEIDIGDIAHALSNQCRFAGHCHEFYSVAQHSVLVARWLEEHAPPYALHGLLHDAAEAYLVDLPRPVKRQPEMEPYRNAEHAIERVIAERFGLVWPWPEIVKRADDVLLATEARDLMARPVNAWAPMPAPWGNRIEPWIPTMARAKFLASFQRLTGRH